MSSAFQSPKLVTLKTNGQDGLLIEKVTVSSGGKSGTFSPGKRFLMCRKEDPPNNEDVCEMSLSPSNSKGPVCKACSSSPQQPPEPITSNFLRLRSAKERGPRLQYRGFAVWMDCSLNAAY